MSRGKRKAAAAAPTAPPYVVDVSTSILSRRWTGSDAVIKGSENRAWARLRTSARAAHDQIERMCGRLCTGGIVVGAKHFNNFDWQTYALTTLRTVAELVRTGWARWNGDDLFLVGYPASAERRFLERRSARRPCEQPYAQPCSKNTALSGGIPPLSSHGGGGSDQIRERSEISAAEENQHDPARPPAPPTPPPNRAGGRAGPSLALTPGQRRMLAAYPASRRAPARLPRFQALWTELGLESHTDWVIARADEQHSSVRRVDDFMPHVDNFISNYLALEGVPTRPEPEPEASRSEPEPEASRSEPWPADEIRAELARQYPRPRRGGRA